MIKRIIFILSLVVAVMASAASPQKQTNKKTDTKQKQTAKSSNSSTSQNYANALNLFSSMHYTEAAEQMRTFERSDVAKSAEQERKMNAVLSAATMLEHVEKMVIVDSLVVDKKDFFKHYRISPEVGHYVSANGIPVYIPESGEKQIWSVRDSVGLNIVQATKMANGKWDEPQVLDAGFQMGGDASYPFMMPDGAKIYFASNGGNSIGGYDIFLAARDVESGKFYKPQNVGMPYNSPYDDYLLVIDEVNNIGWWATDRNRLGDKLTIYIFIPNAVRENYEADDENIEGLARVASIRDTWEDGKDYADVKRRIAAIDVNASKRKTQDFYFVVNNGFVLTRYDQIEDEEIRSMMREYQQLSDEITSNRSALAKARRMYGEGNKSTAEHILRLEQEVATKDKNLKRKANNIRRLLLR